MEIEMPFDGKNAVQEILTPIQEISDPGSWLCGMVVLADRQTAGWERSVIIWQKSVLWKFIHRDLPMWKRLL